MPYETSHDITRMLYRAYTCPYRVGESRCAGGDYCPFPPGEDCLCCMWCPRFDDCPDKAGVCTRLDQEQSSDNV